MTKAKDKALATMPLVKVKRNAPGKLGWSAKARQGSKLKVVPPKAGR